MALGDTFTISSDNNSLVFKSFIRKVYSRLPFRSSPYRRRSSLGETFKPAAL